MIQPYKEENKTQYEHRLFLDSYSIVDTPICC